MMLHLSPADFSSPNYGICRRNFRFHWFSFAFVAATLIGMMIAAAMGQGLHYSRPFWIGERRECTCTLWHCMQQSVASAVSVEPALLIVICAITSSCASHHLPNEVTFIF